MNVFILPFAELPLDYISLLKQKSFYGLIGEEFSEFQDVRRVHRPAAPALLP